MNVELETIFRMYGELSIENALLREELAKPCSCEKGDKPVEKQPLSQEDVESMKDILDA